MKETADDIANISQTLTDIYFCSVPDSSTVVS